MAAFTPNFVITQSTDARTGIISDTSNYGINDQSIVVENFASRSVSIYDFSGNLFDVVDFNDSELTAEFDIPDNVNLWADSTMQWDGANPTADYTLTKIFLLDRITKNKYQSILIKGCCKSQKIDEYLGIADEYFRGAEIAAPSGNASSWQTSVDSANKYLSSAWFL